MTSKALQYGESISKTYEPPTEKTATYSEGFDIGVGSFLSEDSVASRSLEFEDSSLAELMNIKTPLAERNDKVDELRAQRKIPDDLWYNHTEVSPYAPNKTNYNTLTLEMQERGIDIQNDDDVLKLVSEDLANRRLYAEKERKNFGLAAKAGELVGTLTGGLLDVLLTMPAYAFGPSGAVQSSRTIGGTIAKVAATEGAIQAGLEPSIHSFKEDIGSTYTIKDSLANVAMVAGTAGTLSGAAKGLSILVDKVKNNKGLTKVEKRQAVEVLEEHKRQLENAPKQHITAKEYLARLDEEGKFQEGKRNYPDPRPLTDPDVDATNIRIKPRVKIKNTPADQAKAKDIAAKKAEAEAENIPEGLDETDIVLTTDKDGKVVPENAIESIKRDDAREDALLKLRECLIKNG